MKPYILTWLPWLNGPTERQTILDALNSMPEVLNWRAAIGAVFIISDSPATVLSAGIRNRLPNLQYVIVPVDMSVSDGWADRETWNFLQNPQRAR
jgi:hypothetical protein